MEELKKQRGIARGKLTRKRTEIENLMQDQANLETVKDSILKFDEVLVQFKCVHDSYHQQLSNSAEIEASIEYLSLVEENVSEFKANVATWIETVTGADSRESGDREHVEVHPEDSVSQVSSVSQSTVSARARAAARRAALEVEAAALRDRRALEQEELLLRYRREELELRTEMAKVSAEERAYAESEGRQGSSSRVSASQVSASSCLRAWTQRSCASCQRPTSSPSSRTCPLAIL